MKLQYLWIDNFKNLNNAEFVFSNNYTAIIGTNGSGKSNLLEALSYIFYALYQNPTPKITFNCKLHYEIDGKNIKFIKLAGYSNLTLDTCDISFDEYTREHLKYLPKDIIALYSGEEKRLYKQYFYKAEEKYNKANRGQEAADVLRMLYVSSKQWDIFSLLLNVYNSHEEDEKILKEIGCNKIKSITINFNVENLKNNSNKLVSSILNVFNPKNEKSVSFSTEKDIRTLLDELNAFGAAELYANLNICCNSNFVIINKIDIEFDTHTNIERMSEGNKKLILLNGIYKFLVGDNSLILLDEPDTYLHESRKHNIAKILEKNEYGYTVLTTHSSLLVSKLNPDNLIMSVQSANGIEIKSNESLKNILKFIGDTATVTAINGIIESTSPILMLEGQDDVKYIKKALSIFSKKDPKYSKICYDIINFNGAGNVKQFLDNFQKFMPNRKIVCVFDRDDAGKGGIASLLEVKKDTLQMDLRVRKKENVTFFMYPPAYGKTEDGVFLIEDYFRDDFILSEVKRWAENGIKTRYRSQPKLDDQIKSFIRKKFDANEIEEDCYEGFKVLLDELLEIQLNL